MRESLDLTGFAAFWRHAKQYTQHVDNAVDIVDKPDIFFHLIVDNVDNLVDNCG